MDKIKENKMTITLIMVMLILIGLSIFGYIKGGTSKAGTGDMNNLLQEQSLGLGDNFIDFTLKTIDNKDFNLSDIKDKKIFLNFWGTWCSPCAEEIPDLQKLADEYSDEVEVIAVNLLGENEDVEDVKEFLKENNINITVPMDVNGEVGEKYGLFAVPSTYIFDSNGKLGDAFFGEITYEQMVEELQKIE